MYPNSSTLEQHLGRAALDWFAKNHDNVTTPEFRESDANIPIPGVAEESGEDALADTGEMAEAEGGNWKAEGDESPADEVKEPAAYQQQEPSENHLKYKKLPPPTPKKKMKGKAMPMKVM